LKEVFPEIYAKIELLIQLAAHELAKYYQKGMDLGLFNNLNAMFYPRMILFFLEP
jgi:hypothetical protein